ncbi:MAG: P1 family peptidase [Clostridia bacterium]
MTMGSSGSIVDVPGVKVAHHTNEDEGTGLTVLVFPEGSTGSVEIRGGAPGTRETDLLRPENTVDAIDAILLTGGSAFGLDAAAGVMRWLRERGRGCRVGEAIVPIVPAAVIFDEGAARGNAPGACDAERALETMDCEGAEVGRVGAGTGATVGKILGFERASAAGVGTASLSPRGEFKIGALAVVNALGDVIAEDGSVLAGPTAEGSLSSQQMILNAPQKPRQGENTTLVVVATNARLTKSEALRVAVMAADGLARSISPAHTPFDGDATFVVSTGSETADILTVGTAAAEVVARAIRSCVAPTDGQEFPGDNGVNGA